MKYLVLSLLSCLLLAACSQNGNQGVKVSYFDDPIIRSIYQFQDTRNTDSLKTFLRHENVMYRRLAAEAFGSVQDVAAIPDLFSVLLNDEDTLVRKYSAYALGQTQDSLAFEKLFEGLAHEKNVLVRSAMLEAMGKAVSQPLYGRFSALEVNSIPESKGLFKGFYYAAIRNVFDDYAIERAVASLDKDQPFDVRFSAADMLSRLPALDAEKYLESLFLAVDFDQAPEVRMRLALVLGKIKDELVVGKLYKLTTDMDDRVKINALMALRNFETPAALQAVISLLSNKNHQVSTRAAETYSQYSNEFIRKNIQLPLPDIDYWRTRYLIEGKRIAVTKEKSLAEKLIEEYRRIEDPFQKAGILKALSGDIAHFDLVVTETFSTTSKTVSTAGMETLVAYRQSTDFPLELEQPFGDLIKRALLSGDLAMVTYASGLIRDERLKYKSFFADFSFLEEAKSNLKLPADNEALQALEQAIAYVNGVDYEPVKNEWNHPIDFDLLSSLPDTAEMLIQTTEGDIKIRLYPKEAPGSVANFVKLASDGYYNGIAFHRVVPNFVIQGGCNRGDGYGGLDYSIRSEVGPRKYKPGSVGMASAGKDTEGTQFFITHSTTAHLDGRYTIFAEVMDGMDVVDKIGMGSKIKKVIPVARVTTK